MVALGKQIVHHAGIDGSDMQGSGADEEDLVLADDAGCALFPLVVEMEKLPGMGHVLAECKR